MKYTNKLNLPESIARAVQNDTYSAGDSDISVTTLIGPARKRQLEIKHRDEMVTDVADRVWSLYGQIVHSILERADLTDDEIITERRLFITRHGWRLSGQFDRLVLRHETKGTVLQDYKFTSTFTVADGVKPEHEAQANLYRLMMKEHGYNVEALEIVAILRDWSKARAMRDSGYPQHPVAVLAVDVWSDEKTEQYITDRLTVHGEAQTDLPECTVEERWASPTVWKVKKDGNKTAAKGHAYHASQEDADAGAEQLTEETGKPHSVEKVAGESKRCALYCEASAFCEQFHKLNKNKLGL